ncbi:MAG TPA: histidine kinase [Micromonosporaceae bacterium]
MTDRIRAALRAVARGLWLASTAMVIGLPLLIASVVAMALVSVELGEEATPAATRAVRAFTDAQRHRAWRWSGVRIERPYRTNADRDGWRPLLHDPGTWRDLAFLLVNVPLGMFFGLLPLCLAGQVVFGLVAGPIVWGVSGSTSPFWPMDIPIALVSAGLLVWLGPWLLRRHALIAATLLAPTRGELAERVNRLRASRDDVVDTSAAELRRIERDLHDGAQARLVALGMTIGLAERLVRDDPEAAVTLLAEARDTNGQALTDLRDLVRGILPPVLADRGLDGAVRALVATLPIPVAVDVEAGAIDQPVEAALYFAIAESLANVVKHSEATRAWVRVRSGARLTATVGDNGHGGASESAGGGLAGIGRRLDAFDGRLEITSPAGGPTMVVMEIPCGS